MRLSLQELRVCQRLVEAYPAVVAMDDVVDRMAHRSNGGPGDRLFRPSSEVCRIRGLLGYDAIETVWPTRVDSRGRPVREYKAPALGYRAGPRLLEVVGLIPSSEVNAPVADGSAKGTDEKASLRRGRHTVAWQAPEPHRNDGTRVMWQMEAACRHAEGL
jgi:hypothetical protein